MAWSQVTFPYVSTVHQKKLIPEASADGDLLREVLQQVCNQFHLFPQ